MCHDRHLISVDVSSYYCIYDYITANDVPVFKAVAQFTGDVSTRGKRKLPSTAKFGRQSEVNIFFSKPELADLRALTREKLGRLSNQAFRY